MSESETDDTPQIRSETLDLHDESNQGYSLAGGAPKPPTLEDLLRALMLMEIDEACAHVYEPIEGDPCVAFHTFVLKALNALQTMMDKEHYNHDCLEQCRSHGEGMVRGARLMANGEGEQ